jgi:hypothetical protein
MKKPLSPRIPAPCAGPFGKGSLPPVLRYLLFKNLPSAFSRGSRGSRFKFFLFHSSSKIAPLSWRYARQGFAGFFKVR